MKFKAECQSCADGNYLFTTASPEIADFFVLLEKYNNFSGLIQLTCNNAIPFSVVGAFNYCIGYYNHGSLSTTKLNHISL